MKTGINTSSDSEISDSEENIPYEDEYEDKPKNKVE